MLLSFDGTATQNASINLPANSQIISIIVDPLVAFNSATSATLSVGTSSGNTSYVSSVDVKAATSRVLPTFTLTQLGNMQNIGTNTTVTATVSSQGTPTAGSVSVAFLYAQNTNTTSNN